MEKKEVMKKIARFITIISIGIGASIVFASSNNFTRLPTGEDVSIENNKIVIDTVFLKTLTNNPTSKEWSKNYWELIYLINLGHEDSISSGLDILSSAPAQKPIDNHLRIDNLARALSSRDEFWDILAKKPDPSRVAIIEYYDMHRSEYLGNESYEYGRNNVKLNSKK